MNKEDIVEKIVKNTDLSKEEVEEKIKEKKEDMPNISDQGLALMVSKELDVSLQQNKGKTVEIGDIAPNMNNIGFKGKVVNKSPVRTFQTDDGEGKVQNITLSDKTGKVRMSIWNEEIDKYNELKEGDSVELGGARVKEDNLGNPEVRLGYNGQMEKIDEDIETVKPKNSLEEIKANDDVKIDGMVLEIFDRPLVYYFCPDCNQKVYNGVCPEHGDVEADKRLIVAGVIDDGSRSINSVFFGEQAENLLQKSTDQVEEELNDKTTEEFIDSLDIITKEFEIYGQITKNRMSEDLELRVKKVSPKV